LSGEIRPLPMVMRDLMDAGKTWFQKSGDSKANAPKMPIKGLEIHAVSTLSEALDILAEM